MTGGRWGQGGGKGVVAPAFIRKGPREALAAIEVSLRGRARRRSVIEKEGARSIGPDV